MTVPAQQVARRGFVAGFTSRTIAYCIDAVVITTTFSIMGAVLNSLATLLDISGPDLADAARAVALGVGVLTLAAVYELLGWWLFGKTIGKLVMGLRVVREDGGRPRLLQSAVRVIGYGISAAVFMMGFIWILFDGRRRAWHDHMARTYVVYDWDARPRAALLELGQDEAIRPWV